MVGIQIVLLAAAWGDLRRQVRDNRERQDEQHEENQAELKIIGTDVRRINGSVTRHSTLLEIHAEEIDKLRDGS